MAILTALEVIKHSQAGREYPTSQFCELIPQIEQEFARECIGWKLHDYVTSKLRPITEIPGEWDAEAEYVTGDLTLREGLIFECVVSSSTGQDPLGSPSAWEEFERFTDEGVSLLWKMYMRRILAMKVYLSSLTPTTWRSGAGGISVNIGDGYGARSANKSEMIDTKNSIISEIQRTTTNMLEWLGTNANQYNLPYTAAEACLGEKCKSERSKGKRRWAMR